MIYKGGIVVWLILLTVAHSAAAQPAPKSVPRIGFIISSGKAASRQLEASREGLHELGHLEGKNIAIERRYAEGQLDRMPPFVNEFVERKVDVIVGVNNVVIRAAMEATKTIPIVAVTSIDPVSAGYAKSFAQPGGNVTGLASLGRDVSAKRIELLTELLPKLSKLGVLWDPNGPGPAIAVKEYEQAARAFKLELQPFEMRGTNQDLSRLLRAVKAAHVDALIVVANPLTGQLAKQIFELAAKHRLPTMTEERRFVDIGGLISYGANVAELYRRAATYVDKILKGARPADLPMEEPNKFEMVINHKTAKQIGLAIPQSLLVRADKS
ncbi:MAG TPA: ABC transporter substrate-binding protein [Candidatus Binatia bacterium]|nr:ABC transporter substrate-binding protein [Candidatus Binatia bacterium]